MPGEIVRCPRCGTLGSPTHRCVARTLPDRPSERVAPLVPEGRPRPPRELGEDAARELELLARWLPVIEGRSIDPTPSIPSGHAPTNRPDWVDARHRDVADACRVLRRLGALAWRHRLVLLYLYVILSEEARARYGQGLDTRLGFVLVDHKRRLGWHSNRAVSQAQLAAKERGEKLRREALHAYGAVTEGELQDMPSEWQAQARPWLEQARYVVGKLVDLADETQRSGKRGSINRVTK